MLFELTIPPSIKALQNLSTFLDKAAQFADSKKVEMETFFQFRLAPDQLPLGRQIHIACDAAKLGASRLTGKEAPSHPDTEKTLADFKDRIASTVSYLKTIKPEDFNGADKKQITQPRWEGQYLTGAEYAFEHVMPNVYFHVTTAYSIIRHNGVDIGKKDYLGTMPFKK